MIELALYGDLWTTRTADGHMVTLIPLASYAALGRQLADLKAEAARLASELATERSLRCCRHRGTNASWSRMKTW